MKGLKYQMKSVLRDKFCLMTFLLPILVAAALNFMGSIDMSSLGELHFGVLENELSPQTITWLERYGPVTAYKTQEELTAAINEPSTNVIGVRADGDSLKTAVSGDELDIFRQAAATLPALYERREAAGQAEIRTLERPDIMESLQGIFIPAVLIVAMFMGCTFNAMNIISEKEDGVAFINEIGDSDERYRYSCGSLYRMVCAVYFDFCPAKKAGGLSILPAQLSHTSSRSCKWGCSSLCCLAWRD